MTDDDELNQPMSVHQSVKATIDKHQL